MNSNIHDVFRNKIVEKLDKILKNKTNSRIIEKSIYNYIIKLSKEKNIQRSWNNDAFKNLYLTKCRSIYANLDSNSYIKNENFLKNINNGKIDISNIANISIYDIFPENWKEILELKKNSINSINIISQEIASNIIEKYQVINLTRVVLRQQLKIFLKKM